MVFSFIIRFQNPISSFFSRKLENLAAWLSAISQQEVAGAEGGGRPLEKVTVLPFSPVPYCRTADPLPSVHSHHNPSWHLSFLYLSR